MLYHMMVVGIVCVGFTIYAQVLSGEHNKAIKRFFLDIFKVPMAFFFECDRFDTVFRIVVMSLFAWAWLWHLTAA